MQNDNTANGACSGLDRGPSRTTVWPPAWLKSSDAAHQSAPELTSTVVTEPIAPPAAPVPDLQLPDVALASITTPAPSATKCPRCRCTEYIDVPIHGGQSTRRDCARCGRLIDFPVWYGKREGVAV